MPIVKKSLISLLIPLLFSLILLDLWHPHLDQSRLLTKVFDLFYFPWLNLSQPLPNYQLISGQFIFNRRSYPVKAKLENSQWHINFTDQDFQGYRQLILTLPEAANFFNDILALEQAQSLGLVTRDRWFAVVKINNQPARVYQVTEAWTKDVLEKNRRSSDSDLFIPKDYQRLWQSAAFWKKLSRNPLNPQDYSSLHRFLTAGPDELAQLVNLDSFSRWQAYLALNHRPLSEPFLLYFNRDLGQFEFIPDPQPLIAVADTSFLSRLTSLPSIKARTDQLVTDYRQNPQNYQHQLKLYRQLWRQTRFAFAQDFLKPYSTLFFTAQVWRQRPQL